MIEKIKKILNKRNIKIFGFMIFALVIFYFFQWNPGQIRKKCANDSRTFILKQTGGTANSEQSQIIMDAYELCIHSAGLKQ